MDRRVAYTRKAIKDAFLYLLESNTIEEITVKEICGVADINRATFYRNYADIYALYDAIEAELLESAFSDRKIENSFKNLLIMMKENKAFYKERCTISSSNIQRMVRWEF